MEIWRKINPEMYPRGKFGQTYSVSNYGRVRNDKTGKVLKERQGKNRRKRANLAGKDINTHRLVALHFIKNPNPEKFNQVNHIDGDPGNNHYSNLEWCNNSINQKHAYEIGLQPDRSGERNPNYGKTVSKELREKMSRNRKGKGSYGKTTVVVYKDGTSKLFNSICACSNFLGINQNTLSRFLSGRFKTLKIMTKEGIKKIYYLEEDNAGVNN